MGRPARINPGQLRRFAEFADVNNTNLLNCHFERSVNIFSLRSYGCLRNERMAPLQLPVLRQTDSQSLHDQTLACLTAACDATILRHERNRESPPSAVPSRIDSSQGLRVATEGSIRKPFEVQPDRDLSSKPQP
jgi:hypothetical protein